MANVGDMKGRLADAACAIVALYNDANVIALEHTARLDSLVRANQELAQMVADRDRVLASIAVVARDRAIRATVAAQWAMACVLMSAPGIDGSLMPRGVLSAIVRDGWEEILRLPSAEEVVDGHVA